jgi:hypothetical protein
MLVPKPKNVFQSPVVHKAGLNPGLTAAAALLVMVLRTRCYA